MNLQRPGRSEPSGPIRAEPPGQRRPPQGSKGRALLLVLLAIAAAGCSNIKLAYPFMDRLIEHQVQPFLKDQRTRKLAEEEIGRFMGWHTREILPRYATLLREAASRLEADQLDQAAVARLVQQGSRIIERMSRRMIRHTAAVMSRHTSPKQLAHLQRAIWRQDHERLEKKKRPRPLQLKEDTESMVKGVESLTGDLEPRQWPIIWRLQERLLDDPARWLRERRRRRREFLSFMGGHPSAAQIQIFLTQHWITDLAPRSRVRIKQTERVFWELVTSLSTAQRRTLIRNLRGYAEDFAALAREADR